MKGAIGNAFIMNLVITFILIFYMLLIGSMALTKGYKIKNYLVNTLVSYDEKYGKLPKSESQRKEWNEMVNDYLGKNGYNISQKNNSCPTKTGYTILKNTSQGQYEYCVYIKNISLTKEEKKYLKEKYNYMVLTYLKFDFPVIGSYLKLSLTGETKTIKIEQ